MTKRKPKYQNHSDTWLPVDVALPQMNNATRSSTWSEQVLVRVERLAHMPTYETAILCQWYDADGPMWATSSGEDITPYVKAWVSIPGVAHLTP